MFNKIAPYLHISTHVLRRVILSVVIFLLIGTGWLVYEQFSKQRVTITLNEQTWIIRTNAQTVQSALDESEINLEATDITTPDLTSPIENGMEIKIERASQVVLDMDGEISRIYTHQANILDILAEQNITINSTDRLLVNHQHIDASLLPTLRQTPQHIQIIRAKAYSIAYHGQSLSGTTTALTVGDLLSEENLELYLADEINLGLNTPVYDNISLQIKQSTPVMVKIDGLEWQTRIIGTTTVGDVLTALDLSLTGQDYSIPPESDNFADNMTIEVVRVIEVIDVEYQSIPYGVVLVQDEQLSADVQNITQTGMDGIAEIRWRVRQENGVEVSRYLQSKLVIQEPIPQITVVGSAN